MHMHGRAQNGQPAERERSRFAGTGHHNIGKEHHTRNGARRKQAAACMYEYTAGDIQTGAQIYKQRKD